MIQEQEKRPKLTPFERLKGLYEKTFDSNDYFKRGRVKLKDNIDMLIGPRPWNGNPIESFDIDFFSKDKNKSRESGFSFDINKDGSLEYISYPLIVTIGGIKRKEYRSENSIIERIEGSVEDRIVCAEVLVDWLDKIVKENKFSEPPITASISGEQK